MTCAKCGNPMDLDEKDTSSGRDIREYRCSKCGHSDWEDRGPALWQILSDDRERQEAEKKLAQDAENQQQQKTIAFARRAAMASWIMGIMVVVLMYVGRHIFSFGKAPDLALVASFTAMVLGAIALFHARKYGTKGILAFALVGAIVNGLLFMLLVMMRLVA